MGEIDDSETSRVQLDDITGDQMGQDCNNLDGCKPSTNQVTANGSESESNSDDGFGDPNCLLGASEALLANSPFSAVTMDTLVTTPSHMEDKK